MDTKTIDEAAIRSMILNSNFTLAFPFLTSMTTNSVKKACCGRKRTSKVPDYEGIKRAFAELPDARKVQLRELLGAKKVQIKYAGSGGKTIVVIF